MPPACRQADSGLIRHRRGTTFPAARGRPPPRRAANPPNEALFLHGRPATVEDRSCAAGSHEDARREKALHLISFPGADLRLRLPHRRRRREPRRAVYLRGTSGEVRPEPVPVLALGGRNGTTKAPRHQDAKNFLGAFVPWCHGDAVGGRASRPPTRTCVRPRPSPYPLPPGEGRGEGEVRDERRERAENAADLSAGTSEAIRRDFRTAPAGPPRARVPACRGFMRENPQGVSATEDADHQEAASRYGTLGRYGRNRLSVLYRETALEEVALPANLARRRSPRPPCST